jgi:hypothetical protein
VPPNNRSHDAGAALCKAQKAVQRALHGAGGGKVLPPKGDAPLFVQDARFIIDLNKKS